MLAVVGFTTTSYAQTDEWSVLKEIDLTSTENVGPDDLVLEDPFYGYVKSGEGSFRYQDIKDNLSDYCLRLQSDGNYGEYFSVKCNLTAGTYRFTYRLAEQWGIGKLDFFYSNGDPASSEKNVVLEGQLISTDFQNYTTSEFTVPSDGDYYLGVVTSGYLGGWANFYFTKFSVEMKSSSTGTSAEASYDDFCKPTMSTNGNKRYQTKGEIVNGNGLSESTPKEFAPTLVSGSNQSWSNNDEQILANPGADFDLKVTYAQGAGFGTLTIFQLRSDNMANVSMLGQYLGDWGVSNGDDIFVSLGNAKDSSNGFIKEVVNTSDEQSATFNISIPDDISVGELVVVRFIICKKYNAASGGTSIDNCELKYEEDPCDVDATEMNYCDYVIRIVDGSYVPVEKYAVTITEPENGTIKVMNGDAAVNSGDKVEKGTELTITAEPSEGYVLGSVTVNSVELEGNTYTVNEDVTIAATFNATKVSASVESANTEQGSVAFEGRDESSVTVDYGTKLTLTATPATGYMFDKWTDKTTGNVLSYRYTLEISVVSDTAYVANFVAEDYPLMTRYYEVGLSQQNRYLANASYRTAEEAKSVDLFNCETEEELPFVEYKELHVAQREGAVVDKTSTPVNITEGATEFYMSFQQYNKNIVVGDETCEPELGWTKQTAYIDWNNDKKFEGDEIYDALGNQNGGDENTFGDTNGNVVDGWSRRFPVPADVKAGTYRMRVVFFAPKDPVTEKTLFTEGFGEIRNGVAYDFNVVVGEVPEEYTVAWETPQNGKLVVLNANDTIKSGDKVLENTVLTVKAIPADSTYQVVEVKDGETVLEADSEGIYSVTVAADVNLTATFEKIQYSVTWEAPQNGMLVVKNGNDTIKSGDLIDAGTVLTVVATPDENYELTSLTYKTGDEEAVELDGTQFKLNGNTVLAATFGLVQYDFTYDIVGGSWVADVTITYSNGEAIENGAKLGYGTEFIVKAVKKISQYTYVNILVNNEQVTADVSGNTYTYTGKVEGDTYVKVDMFSDINDVDSEAVYYDGATETIYTAGADVKVYDMSGRLVLNAEDVESVSVAELNDGLYTAVVGETVLKFRK